MTVHEDFDHLHVDQRGNILFLTLARPEVRNAIDQRMVDEFHRACDLIEAEPTVRVVSLRGAAHTFCAGGDLTEMRAAFTQGTDDEGNDPLVALNRRFGTLLERLDALSTPIVASVEGAALGGGMGLACIADLVLAESQARLGLPEARLGLVPAQIAPFVVRRIGLARARSLALAGRTVDAQEALQLGLVDEVYDGVEALEAAMGRRITEFLLCAPGAVATTKELLFMSAQAVAGESGSKEDLDLAGVLDEAARRFALAARGDEAREGMAAFREDRLPDWDDAGAGEPAN